MSKLAKDMTDAEFDKYCDDIAEKIFKIVPQDMLFVVGLYARNDENRKNFISGTLNRDSTIVMLEHHRQWLLNQKLRILDKLASN